MAEERQKGCGEGTGGARRHRETALFWGLFIAAWFGTMGLLLSDGMGNGLAREL